MFSRLSNDELAQHVEALGEKHSIDFWDTDGNQTAFSAPDGFATWLAEVQKRLRRG